jgi:SAM-dependent methyltransferase
MSVELNKYGFYSLIKKPTAVEIEQYYAEKYYQEASNNYEQQYTDEEIQYFNNKISQKFYLIEKKLSSSLNRSMLDIGCGEGWALKFFREKGWMIKGIDYSNYGCLKFNPDCVDSIVVGDIYNSLDTLIADGQKFEVIWLDNVLEHVLEPDDLIARIKKIILPNGILIIEVPNDFSVIQKYALDRGYVGTEFWIAIPDHISYFNRVGLENILIAHGWRPLSFLSDYPIDWNLLNPDTNYIKDRSKGKNCHKERVNFENLIHDVGVEKVVTLYQALADMGLGRQITGFFQPLANDEI